MGSCLCDWVSCIKSEDELISAIQNSPTRSVEATIVWPCKAEPGKETFLFYFAVTTPFPLVLPADCAMRLVDIRALDLQLRVEPTEQAPSKPTAPIIEIC